MDLPCKFGVATVMIIPTFAWAGVIWDRVQSWIAILVWICLMASTCAYVLLRRGS